MNAKCKPNPGDDSAKGTFSFSKQETCAASLAYEGPNACGSTLPIVKSFSKLAPFFGALLIIFGLVMAFFGTKFLFFIFGSIIGLIIALILFCVCYALFLPPNTEVGLLAGVICVCVLLGGLGAYFSYHFSKKYTVPILGLAAGIFACLMLARILSLKQIYSISLAIVGGIIGWFLGQKLRGIIKAVSTSIVGSFLFVRGVGLYAPGFPSEIQVDVKEIAKDPNANIELIGYLVAFIVIAIAGAVV